MVTRTILCIRAVSKCFCVASRQITYFI